MVYDVHPEMVFFHVLIGFLVTNVPWVIIKKIGMRFELEEEIAYIHRKQEHSSAAGDGQETFLAIIVEITDKRVSGCWCNQVPIARMSGTFRAMVGSGNHEGCLRVHGGTIIRTR